MATPKVLIISGNGFNCEIETKYAFEMVGGHPEIVHMNDITSGEFDMINYQIIAFIGGFSYGDHLGGGKVTSNKFRFQLKEKLYNFISKDTLIIGICNGFQVITQMGILPGFENNYNDHSVTLTNNSSSRYEDRWVNLKVNNKSNCLFTKNLDKLYFPVRHGEGKLTSKNENIIKRLFESEQVVLQYIHPDSGEPTEEYPYNPNGSVNGIAGICDPSGRIFGLMPHPEAFLSPYNHPFWTRINIENRLPDEGEGVQIFRNAVDYFS
ncbi:phosphoribosylformylglycinamidine synthase I [candidate division KSB1 bacterium]